MGYKIKKFNENFEEDFEENPPGEFKNVLWFYQIRQSIGNHEYYVIDPIYDYNNNFDYDQWDLSEPQIHQNLNFYLSFMNILKEETPQEKFKLLKITEEEYK